MKPANAKTRARVVYKSKKASKVDQEIKVENGDGAIGDSELKQDPDLPDEPAQSRRKPAQPKLSPKAPNRRRKSNEKADDVVPAKKKSENSDKKLSEKSPKVEQISPAPVGVRRSSRNRN